LLVLSILAPIWATIAYQRGWIYYNASGWGSMAFWMNGMWALWNCYFALYVVRHTLAMKQQRDDHRFADQLAIEVCVEGEGSAALVPALTADINPAGLGFRATQRVEPGSRVSIQLPLGNEKVWTMGEVRYVNEESTRLGNVYMHGVAFDPLTIEVRDAIELYCTRHSMPIWRMKYRQSIDIFTRASEVVQNLRGTRRRLAGLPAQVYVNGASDADPAKLSDLMILEDVSASGARLVGAAPIAPGTSITFNVPGAKFSGAGTVRHVQALQSSVAVLFSMGIEFDAVPVRARSRMRPFGNGKNAAPAGTAYVS
jgi:hypothetical protein